MASDNPSRPIQHSIGDFGERLVTFLLPSEWVVHHYRGTEDYGLDLHVEIFRDGRPTGLEFGVQVKTVDGTSADAASFPIKISRNALWYMAGKPYPSMLVVASRTDEAAHFCWLQELIPTPERLKSIVAREAQGKHITLTLRPVSPLKNASGHITGFLDRRRKALSTWVVTSIHRELLLDLYLDQHAALDAVIECLALTIERNGSPDEVAHKLTYSFTLTVMAYGIFYGVTSVDKIQSLGPLGSTLLALQQQFRELLLEMIPEEFLAKYESGDESIGAGGFAIMPARHSAFLPAAPRIARVLRELLGSIAQMLHPSRDFSHGMSGLAATVMHYKEHTAGD